MTTLISGKPALNQRQLLLVVAVVVLLGVVTVLLARGAGPLASFEPESGALAGGATVQTVTGASGSSVVKFAAATTTSPTPTPVAGNCVGGANTPGGADPWGGCFPGAQNTGYPHGLAGDTRTPVTLTNYAGSCTLSTSVTIDGKNINCDIQINAPGGATVTIKNSKINGKVFHDPGYNPSSWPSITIQDTEILGGEGGNYSGIMFGNYTLRRVNLTGGNHNAYCAYNCVIEDSWIHAPVSTPGSHNNAIFFWGSGLQVRHSTIACDIPTLNDGGCSSDLFMKGGVDTATVDRNLLVATTVGGFYYCAYGGEHAPAYSEPQEHDIKFTNNVFQRGPTGKCGGLTAGGSGWAITSFDSSAPGNVWSGNVWDDGTAVQLQ